MKKFKSKEELEAILKEFIPLPDEHPMRYTKCATCYYYGDYEACGEYWKPRAKGEPNVCKGYTSIPQSGKAHLYCLQHCKKLLKNN